MRLPSSRGLSIASSQHAKIDPARSCPCPGSPRGTCPGAAPGPGLRQCRPALDSVAPGPGRGRPRLSQEPALGPRLGDFRRDRLSFGGEASSRLRTPDGARPDKQWTGLCRHGGHDQERHAAAGVLEPHCLWRSNAEIPSIPRDALIVCSVSGGRRPVPSRPMPRSASCSRMPWDRPARLRGSPPTELRSPPMFARWEPPSLRHRASRPVGS